MCNTFPRKEKIEASKIYIDPDHMFDGIEKVYPDVKIMPQKYRYGGEVAMLEDAGILECCDCGSTGLFQFEHGSGRTLITLDKSGGIHMDLQASLLPIGTMPIYDDENDRDGFLNILEDYLQNNSFYCVHCKGMMGWTMWNAESHDDCPGCFLCMKGTKMGAVNFCVEESFTGRCVPGKDCEQCKGHYNMIRFGIKPKNIIISSDITKERRNEIYEANDISSESISL